MKPSTSAVAGAVEPSEGPARGSAAGLNGRSVRNRVDRKKLLLSKWTAVSPIQKEKHFLVVRLVDPERAGDAIEKVELEAVISGRAFVLPWRDLGDTANWKQGWITD